MHRTLLSILLFTLVGSLTLAPVWPSFELRRSTAPSQAIGDSNFNASVTYAAYLKNHPKVLFDEAHNNSYTAAGNYKPFVELITNDGYKVVPNRGPLSRKSLSGYDLLVIVNAEGPQGGRDSSPFSEEECDAARDWVSAGGALLLISDHAPFSAAVAKLSQRFDVSLSIGYTIDSSKFNRDSSDQTELEFTRSDGLFPEHPITQGRNATERINRVLTFSGTSATGPPGSVALLKLSDTARDVLPPDRKPTAHNPSPDHKTASAAGRAQAIALQVGKGRVVVLAEAAMLTAQVTPGGLRFGMNVSADNRQFALNIVHWLSGLLR